MIMVAVTMLLTLQMPGADAALVGPPPPPPPSEGDLARAKALFSAGADAFALGRYDVAIAAFEPAYAIAPRESVTFSLAQALRLQYFVAGQPLHLERAVTLYRAYLNMAPNGARRKHASEHLAALVPILERNRIDGVRPRAERKRPTRLIVSSNTPGATVELGNQPPQPSPASFEVAPGINALRVFAENFEDEARDIDLSAGDVVAVNIELRPTPGHLEIVRGPMTTTYVDGVAIDGTELELSPGAHRVAVSGHSRVLVTQDIDIRSGETAFVDMEQELTAQTWTGIVIGAAGGLLAFATVIPLTVVGINEFQGWQYDGGWTGDDGKPFTTAESEQYKAFEAQRDTAAQAAVIVFAAGAIVALAGGALIALDFPSAPTLPEEGTRVTASEDVAD